MSDSAKEASRIIGSAVVVGILGGMGPLATVDFYNKIIHATPATCDQEHLRVVIWADPTIPDRTAALSGSGVDPTPWLLHGAHQLEALGAHLIATPCNTAHAFLSSIRGSLKVSILDMIEETTRVVTQDYPTATSVGLLATTGTIGTRLYQHALERHGVRVLTPDALTQNTRIMEAIYMVKAGELGDIPIRMIENAARNLVQRGADLLLAGCTELPLLMNRPIDGIPVLDPTTILAQAVVREAQLRHLNLIAPWVTTHCKVHQ